MASTGHAPLLVASTQESPAFVAVVVVEPSLAARAAMAVAGLVIPPGLLLSFLSADESAPLGRSAEAPLALVCLGVALFVAGVYALLRGTVRARLLIDHREVDALTWTFAPKRPLRATHADKELTAELTAGPGREVRFAYAGGEPRAVPVR